MRELHDHEIFKEGQEVNHKVFGKGKVIGFPMNIDRYERIYHYVEVQFDNEVQTPTRPGKTRTFLPEDLTKFLVD